MFEIKVVIPGLEELAVAINNLAGAKSAEPKKVTKKEEKKVTTEPEEKKPEEELPRAEGEVIYTLEQVRAKMTELSRAGKAKAVKDILTSLDASNLSSLDPAKYAEAMEKAGAL